MTTDLITLIEEWSKAHLAAWMELDLYYNKACDWFTLNDETVEDRVALALIAAAVLEEILQRDDVVRVVAYPPDDRGLIEVCIHRFGPATNCNGEAATYLHALLGVSVGSGPVVSTSHKTGLSETRPPIEWRCVHDTGGQAMNEPYQDIEQLTGSALAAAVAVKVMGWRRLGVAWLNGPHADHHAASVIDFRPDLNIAQAWEVVEKMKAEGFSLDLEYLSNGTSYAGFQWPCDDPETDDHYENALAKSVPEAICLAALAAMRAKP